MSQVSSKLRRGPTGYFHWCPGCEETHQIPDSWTFDGNIERPTFTPSVKLTWATYDYDSPPVNGEYAKTGDCCCHYNLTTGVLVFHGDCTHAIAGRSVPLPDLPPDP